jgi:hypothetical protein
MSKQVTLTLYPDEAWEIWVAEVPDDADEEWVRGNFNMGSPEVQLLSMIDSGATSYSLEEVEF